MFQANSKAYDARIDIFLEKIDRKGRVLIKPIKTPFQNCFGIQVLLH